MIRAHPPAEKAHPMPLRIRMAFAVALLFALCGQCAAGGAIYERVGADGAIELTNIPDGPGDDQAARAATPTATIPSPAPAELPGPAVSPAAVAEEDVPAKEVHAESLRFPAEPTVASAGASAPPVESPYAARLKELYDGARSAHEAGRGR